MKVFDAYGLYYDLLYKDKDYRGETDYVHSLITAHGPVVKSILELGSGTGVHACLFAEKGCAVTGVDQSESMLRMAEARKLSMDDALQAKLEFVAGDIRSFSNGKEYDAVISLFHVMSYMRSGADLLSAFRTAEKHLSPGGVFVFDCWHGPGVLHDRPARRVKTFSDEQTEIVRTANPVLHEQEHIVDVKFDIEVRGKQNDETMRLHETHVMRYLWEKEIAALCKKVNLKLVAAEEWRSRKPLTERSWNACYVCKKS